MKTSLNLIKSVYSQKIRPAHRERKNTGPRQAPRRFSGDVPEIRTWRRNRGPAALEAGQPPFRHVLIAPLPWPADSHTVDALRAFCGTARKSTVVHHCDHSLRTGSGPVTADDLTCPRCLRLPGGWPAGRPLLDDDLAAALAVRPDLIITASPERARARARAIRNFRRRTDCSLWLIPPGSAVRTRRICVPVDCSLVSRRALKVAIAMARAADVGEIIIIHVYSVPVGYISAGRRYEEMVGIMRAVAERRVRRLMGGLSAPGTEIRLILEINQNPARGVLTAASREHADLIICGARGRRNRAAALLLPSVSERILRRADVPCLAVKAPGRGISVGQAFMML